MTGSRFAQGVAVTIMLLGVCDRAGAQNASEAPARSAVAPAGDAALADALPVSLDRIRRQLAREPVLILDREPTFRSGVTERRSPDFDRANLDSARTQAPVWQTGWHDEFVNMVTPPEFRQWQAFTGTDLLQVAATSVVQALAGKAITAASSAIREAHGAAVRRQVDEALAQYLAP
jgi:hypothetical protein